jgi:hypothetical protein
MKLYYTTLYGGGFGYSISRFHTTKKEAVKDVENRYKAVDSDPDCSDFRSKGWKWEYWSVDIKNLKRNKKDLATMMSFCVGTNITALSNKHNLNGKLPEELEIT